MTIDFGLGLLFGPPPGRTGEWLATLDTCLPQLTPHFRSVWMTDHFFWEGQPTYEAMTSLTYLAARFPNIDVGPMVLGQNYRNPALLAQMGATLQALSNGRFVLGLGAGWKEDEYNAYNYPFPTPKERVEQLEEALIVIRKLWTEPGQVSVAGKHYSVTDAWCEPKPTPRPPIMVGGSGTKTMSIAAKHADWWNMSDTDIAGYREKSAILMQHCDAIGRDRASMRMTWFGRMAIGRTEAEAQARANSRAIQYSTANAFVGTPAQIVDQMAAFVAHGVTYFMVDVIGLPDPDVIDMVTTQVVPAVKALG
jgi:alkanesulfonate monooxygenase SsuD/methylene tetrahydromethanopterin reductase-like flavin-dependent oxidoreductase (luciferase family)